MEPRVKKTLFPSLKTPCHLSLGKRNQRAVNVIFAVTFQLWIEFLRATPQQRQPF